MHDEFENAKLIKDLKSTIDGIHIQLNELNINLNDSMKHVNEHCDKLRNEIKYTTLGTIQKINQIGQNLVDQVNEFESNYMKLFYENNLRDSYYSLVHETNCFDMKWSDYLKQSNIDYDHVRQGSKMATEIQNKALSEKNR